MILYSLSVAPGSATAGSTTTFTLTFTAQVSFDGGSAYLQVPAGWSPPQQTAPGSPGYISCTSGCLATPTVSGMTIDVPDLAGVPDIVVSYLATVPGPAASDAFTAAVQQTAQGAPQTVASASVTVSGSTVSPSSGASTGTASISPSSGVSTSSSGTATGGTTSTSTKGGGGSASHPVVLLLAGAVAAVALVLLGVWLARRRPVPVTGQAVQAVPHSGQPAQVGVRPAGTEPTRTVRIEPHPGSASTTIEEPQP